jgi:hypothetical protein
MAKTMRARPAWLFRRCPIGNDFPTVLHVEGQRREREREIRVSSGFFAGRCGARSPRAPRSGPAPKVHWSM